ncbi:microfibrillar-associated protein [Galdieria sulphuraria]|uniref:Microfibrillar-associated protein n=1 Tax=Galdieria sulphuraria TaxID=130081 RepID=M2Y1A7_GALSU|nr:microfibrillar-associated protein [Galdieria sulphuraria]EME29599.1 microfibrillar-associated protein [Galdieria sulphuraria]|eukprot:XP_005706119.1 microfibrillar-associated protein [Galdieria sulphuraria]
MANSSKPKERYWPGKVPEYALKHWEDEEDDFFNLIAPQKLQQKSVTASGKVAAPNFLEGSGNSSPSHHSRVDNVKQRNESNTESALERRARIKAQVLRKRQTEPDLLDKQNVLGLDNRENYQGLPERKVIQQRKFQQEASDSSQGSSSSHEYLSEDDSGDSEASKEEEADEETVEDFPRLWRPVFVNKNQRETVEEREKIEQDAEREKQARDSRKEFRRQQAHSVVTQTAAETKSSSVKDDVDLDDLGLELPDDKDREAEYELELMKWKIRELRRLQREHDRDEERKRELREIERRRNMSEEERKKEDQERLRRDEKLREEKPKMAFLQKYYHKGVFFMEQDDSGRYKEDIYNRNFMEGTEEDLVDRTYLPKVMQTRRGQFGFKGRTKYTHLTNEDTTFGTTYGNKKPELSRDELELIRKRKASELKGSDSVFERPRGPKKV